MPPGASSLRNDPSCPGPTKEAAMLKILLIIAVVLAVLWFVRTMMARSR